MTTQIVACPASSITAQLALFPQTLAITERRRALWPEHQRYFETRFCAIDSGFETRNNELALKVIGDELDVYCAGYR